MEPGEGDVEPLFLQQHSTCVFFPTKTSNHSRTAGEQVNQELGSEKIIVSHGGVQERQLEISSLSSSHCRLLTIWTNKESSDLSRHANSSPANDRTSWTTTYAGGCSPFHR
jgi:hypothetical protein